MPTVTARTFTPSSNDTVALFRPKFIQKPMIIKLITAILGLLIAAQNSMAKEWRGIRAAQVHAHGCRAPLRETRQVGDTKSVTSA